MSATTDVIDTWLTLEWTPKSASVRNYELCNSPTS